MLHHQTEVGRDIWFALNGIDNHTLGLRRGRWRQFDKGGETSTTHTNDTSVFDTIHNLFWRQFGVSFYRFQLI